MSIDRPRDDAGYFHARAIEEQLAAQRATSVAARERHDEMAAVYRFKEMLSTRPQRATSECPFDEPRAAEAGSAFESDKAGGFKDRSLVAAA